MELVEEQDPVSRVVLYPPSPWLKGVWAHWWEGVGDPMTEEEGCQYRALTAFFGRTPLPPSRMCGWTQVSRVGFLEEVWEVSTAL